MNKKDFQLRATFEVVKPLTHKSVLNFWRNLKEGDTFTVTYPLSGYYSNNWMKLTSNNNGDSCEVTNLIMDNYLSKMEIKQIG